MEKPVDSECRTRPVFSDRRKKKNANQVISPAISSPKASGWDFYRHVLGSPKFFIAPMVDASELPFRLLCKHYGAQVGYTPMMHSKSAAVSKTYRSIYFSTCPQDAPLFAQFCANDPEELLQAARFVDGACAAVDLNLGCPQNIARRGNYGAFLLDGDWNLIFNMVSTLHRHLSTPVTCKIRILPSLERTLELAKGLERAGCQLLVVHGRTKEQKGRNTGLANWDVIRAVREALSIPVVANGNIRSLEDVEKCLKYTGCAGVMSAEGLLKNPALFSGRTVSPFVLSRQYLHLCAQYPTELRFAKGHIHDFLRESLEKYMDLNRRVSNAPSFDALWDIVDEVERRVQTNHPPVSLTKEASQESAVEGEDILASTGIDFC